MTRGFGAARNVIPWAHWTGLDVITPRKREGGEAASCVHDVAAVLPAVRIADAVLSAVKGGG